MTLGIFAQTSQQIDFNNRIELDKNKESVKGVALKDKITMCLKLGPFEFLEASNYTIPFF